MSEILEREFSWEILKALQRYEKVFRSWSIEMQLQKQSTGMDSTGSREDDVGRATRLGDVVENKGIVQAVGGSCDNKSANEQKVDSRIVSS